MPNFNQVTFIGHLTRDPELKFLPSNMALCTGGIAASEKYTTKSGEKKEDTCFIDFAVWGKQGETFKQYMAKGRAVMLIGRLKLETWDDKASGAKRSKHTINVDRFVFLGDAKAAPGGTHSSPSVSAPTDAPPYTAPPGSYFPPAETGTPSGDSIPF